MRATYHFQSRLASATLCKLPKGDGVMLLPRRRLSVCLTRLRASLQHLTVSVLPSRKNAVSTNTHNITKKHNFKRLLGYTALLT